MNKMYEAPKAELINLDVNKDFMAGGITGSIQNGETVWES